MGPVANVDPYFSSMTENSATKIVQPEKECGCGKHGEGESLRQSIVIFILVHKIMSDPKRKKTSHMERRWGSFALSFTNFPHWNIFLFLLVDYNCHWQNLAWHTFEPCLESIQTNLSKCFDTYFWL